MTNHLGNVLTVINDIKVPYLEQDNLLFKATIMRTYDYSPFGVQLDGRSAEREFCESETNEVTVTDLDNNFNDGTTQGWAQTSVPATVLTNSNNRLRIRRRPTHATYTPTDNWDTGIPIDAHKTVQLNEGVLYSFSALVDRNTCTGITIRVRLVDSDGNDVIQPILANPSGITAISFSYTPQQTGNYKLIFEGVESTILCNFNVDDILITHQESVTSQVNCVGAEGYRYGYQGSEKDDEMKGEGNSYTTEFRMLDTRLGRWLSIDPLAGKFPWQSPYVSMDNNPINIIDPYGLEGQDWIKKPGSSNWEWSNEICSPEAAQAEGLDYAAPGYKYDIFTDGEHTGIVTLGDNNTWDMVSVNPLYAYGSSSADFHDNKSVDEITEAFSILSTGFSFAGLFIELEREYKIIPKYSGSWIAANGKIYSKELLNQNLNYQYTNSYNLALNRYDSYLAQGSLYLSKIGPFVSYFHTGLVLGSPDLTNSDKFNFLFSNMVDGMALRMITNHPDRRVKALGAFIFLLNHSPDIIDAMRNSSTSNPNITLRPPQNYFIYDNLNPLFYSR